MELREAIQNINEFSESEKEMWTDRCEELKASGMGDAEVIDQIIVEMRSDVDSDLDQLKKSLGNK